MNYSYTQKLIYEDNQTNGNTLVFIFYEIKDTLFEHFRWILSHFDTASW